MFDCAQYHKVLAMLRRIQVGLVGSCFFGFIKSLFMSTLVVLKRGSAKTTLSYTSKSNTSNFIALSFLQTVRLSYPL